MPKRNTWILLLVVVTLVLSLLIVFPIDRGILGHKGVRLGLDLQGGVHMVYRADTSSLASGDVNTAMDGVVAILENRVNPLGVTEPLIQRQGTDRILVELPGTNITEQEKESLGNVDILEFGEQAAEGEEFKWEDELGKWKPATATVNGEVKALTSRYFKTNSQISEGGATGGIELVFEWDEEGAVLSEAITGRLIGKPLGIFEGSEPLRAEDGIPIAPTVKTTITSRGSITGLTLNDATRLSKQLNYGRLPVPLEVIYDQTVSPLLGSDFVRLATMAGIIGVAMVMLFMTIYYRISGFMSSLSLAYYAVLLLAIFKLFGVTLTLAGIGGFVLTIGMAIDANVLIFERMKEELWAGRALNAAIDAGFKRAWSAIWDSNITTILSGVILFWLGSTVAESAPVKGFALTLIIGVAASMYTAVTVTRTLIRPFAGTTLAQNKKLFAPYQRKESV